MLAKTQSDFTQRIRTQGETPLPANVTETRMAVYQELVLNNINTIIGACFPVMQQILSEEAWFDLVKGFLREYHATSPLFHELPKAFVDYLFDIRAPLSHPFLAELAHYEWLELHVSLIDADISDRLIDFNEDTLNAKLSLSPLARLHLYQYAVDKIGADYTPQETEPFAVVVYRNIDDEVNFYKLNEVTVRLIDLIDKQQMSVFDAIETLYQDFTSMPEEQFFSFSIATLKELANESMLVLNPISNGGLK